MASGREVPRKDGHLPRPLLFALQQELQPDVQGVRRLFRGALPPPGHPVSDQERAGPEVPAGKTALAGAGDDGGRRHRRRASTRPSGRRADRAGREDARPEKGPEAALHRPHRAAPRPLLPVGCAGRGAEKRPRRLPLPHRRRGRGVSGQRESGHWGKGADGLGLLAEKSPAVPDEGGLPAGRLLPAADGVRNLRHGAAGGHVLPPGGADHPQRRRGYAAAQRREWHRAGKIGPGPLGRGPAGRRRRPGKKGPDGAGGL